MAAPSISTSIRRASKSCSKGSTTLPGHSSPTHPSPALKARWGRPPLALMPAAQIHYESALSPESRQAVVDGLVAFNRSQTPGFSGPLANIGLLLKHPETGAVEGGLTGRVSFGWLFVELLFVPEHLRGQGIGQQLMAE